MPRDRSPPEASTSRRYDRDDYRTSRSHRSRSRSPDRRAEGSTSRRNRSASVSSSEDSDRNRKRHRSSKSRDGETREERKERKRAKKERRAAKDAKRSAKDEKRKARMGVATEFGRYGILTDADIFTKDAEFRTWLIEERKQNPETISQAKSKELFKVFAEDFNTCTLPHEKYYALDDYGRRMRSVRMGEDIVPEIGYDPRADEEAARASWKKPSKKDQPDSLLSRDQLLELQKVQRERVESAKMKRLGMEVKDSVGVRYQ